ncbi:MAG: hypothetical protein AAF847_09290 [Bacteroidota bacterium]
MITIFLLPDGEIQRLDEMIQQVSSRINANQKQYTIVLIDRSVFTK